MLLWLVNLDFAASGGEGIPPSSYSGRYKQVYVVSASGRTKWVDYIPVTYVAASGPKIDTWDDDGGLAVVTLADVTGLVEWVDYIPVVETGSSKNRYDDSGYIAVVEVEE